MTKKDKKQLNMFQGGDDLPLFSGTAQTAKDPAYQPREEAKQAEMFNYTCPICKNTGWVLVGLPDRYDRCICGCEPFEDPPKLNGIRY